MDELDPTTKTSEDKNSQNIEVRRIFWLGIIIGSGISLTISALIAGYRQGFLGDTYYKWQLVPPEIWIIFLVIFITLFFWVRNSFYGKYL